MALPLRCPVCNFDFADVEDSGYTPPSACPYAGAPYPEICSLHDQVYFGKWRKMDADAYAILRAYRKILRLLAAVRRSAEETKDAEARRHLKKAAEALDRAFPEGDPYESVKYMDEALSYAHHAINALIRPRGGRPHLPSDYEVHYNVVLPFKEDL